MSRLSDALRRADEESKPVEARSKPGEPGTGDGPFRSLSSPDQGSAAPPPDEKPAKPSKLLKTFVDQCSRTEWAPDPEAILFYGKGFHTLGCEEFRTLRSRLNAVRERTQLKKLLITSPMPGEGKTFVAANLAQVIVWQPEQQVLLIDADLRAPRLHQALGVPSTPGLSDYLSGDANEFDVIRRGTPENFFFIPSGKTVSNSSELVANSRLRALLARLAIAFDWIIVDSPPVIPVADAKLISEPCDGVLMVVQAGVTPADLAQRAYRELQGKPFLGVVLNRIEARLSYGYNYYPRPQKQSRVAGDEQNSQKARR
jgi:protein-tyrosine kinase